MRDEVVDFVTNLHSALSEKNISKIHSVYENSFNKLTNIFGDSRWPTVDTILPLVNNDQQVGLLYSELFYRHIYFNSKPTPDERVGSWNNYSQLFDFILEKANELVLPEQWLWDMVDEYVYQFQNYQYSKFSKKSAETPTIAPEIWDAQSVITTLQKIIDTSKVVDYLKSAQGDVEEGHSLSIKSTLGYFSIIGLFRVNCLLCEYQNALNTLSPINLTKKNLGLYTRVSACHITLYYYLGFTYTVTKRYAEAIKAFSTILSFVSHSERQTRSYQHKEILKKNEQICSLLALALALAPQQVDYHVHQLLQEKLGEKIGKLNQLDEKTFDELFTFACPKFINTNPASTEFNFVVSQQKEAFLSNVKQQRFLSTVNSYLKLYTSIAISKLAKFCQVEESYLKTQLEAILSGSEASPTNFKIENETIFVTQVQSVPRYESYLIDLIEKYAELTEKLEAA